MRNAAHFERYEQNLEAIVRFSSFDTMSMRIRASSAPDRPPHATAPSSELSTVRLQPPSRTSSHDSNS